MMPVLKTSAGDYHLCQRSIDILRRAAQHPEHFSTYDSGGTFGLQIGPEPMYSPDEAREAAELRQCIEELVAARLIAERPSSTTGFHYFNLTQGGFHVADMLPRENGTAPTDDSAAG